MYGCKLGCGDGLHFGDGQTQSQSCGCCIGTAQQKREFRSVSPKQPKNRPICESLLPGLKVADSNPAHGQPS